MRRVLAMVVLTTAVLVIAQAPASASCVGPGVTLSRTSGAPSSAVVVQGSGFFVGCNDLRIAGQPPPPREPPDKGIRIQFRQGDKVVTLATVDAASDYTFRASVRVPAGAARGSATIIAAGTQANATQAFRVVAQQGSALPRTGTPSGLLAVAAFGLALSGVGLCVLGVRRYAGRD